MTSKALFGVGVEMKEYEGKICKLEISKDNAKLFYSAYVYKVDDVHIHFIDKYKERHSFPIANVKEASTSIKDHYVYADLLRIKQDYERGELE